MRRLVVLLLSVACAVVVVAQNQAKPQGRLPHQLDQQFKALQPRGTPTILYHSGPVMVSATNLYIVYYGSFTATQHSILDTFLQNLGGSPAYNVNTEYFNAQNQFIQNVLNYSPATDSYNDAYSLGTNLSGSFVTTILHNAVAGGHLPTDTNGIYMLTISPDVKLPKSVWCAYHSHTSSLIVSGVDIKYALAADPPPSILTSCSGNLATFGDTTSPNGDIGMDEVVDSLIHELSETVTDPDLSAWYTKGGAEVGDLCNFIYGPTFLAPNGSHANHVFGNRNYLAQEIWSMENPVACVQSH
jgi:hypothetical protein